MAESRDLKFRLLAPTGRAARRLTEATEGAPASTIHKALEWIPGEIPGQGRGLADRGRPRDRRRVVDALAGDLPAPDRRDRPGDPPGADRRRRPAAAGRARQAVLRADRLGDRADGPARARLPAGAAVDDRRRRPLDPPRRAAAARARSTSSRRSATSSATAARRADALADDVITMATERIPAEFGFDPARQVQILSPHVPGAARDRRAAHADAGRDLRVGRAGPARAGSGSARR